MAKLLETLLWLVSLLLLASLLVLLGFRDVTGASVVNFDSAIAAVSYPRAPAAVVVFVVAGVPTFANIPSASDVCTASSVL